jgi:hypothetical protein
MTLGTTDGATSDSLYWGSNFNVVGGPPSIVPPGTLTPRSGGPVSVGTTVFLPYFTMAPVDAVVNVITSMHPVDAGQNVVPADGVVTSIFLTVY